MPQSNAGSTTSTCLSEQLSQAVARNVRESLRSGLSLGSGGGGGGGGGGRRRRNNTSDGGAGAGDRDDGSSSAATERARPRSSLPVAVVAHASTVSLDVVASPPRTADAVTRLASRAGWLETRDPEDGGAWRRRWCCVVPHTFLYCYEQEAVMELARRREVEGGENEAEEQHDEDEDYAPPRVGGTSLECGLVGLDVGYGGVACRRSSSRNVVDDDDDDLLRPTDVVDLEAYSAVETLPVEREQPPRRERDPRDHDSRSSSSASSSSSWRGAENDGRAFRLRGGVGLDDDDDDDADERRPPRLDFRAASRADADDWCDSLLHDRFGALADEVDAHRQVREGAEAQMRHWSDIVERAESKTQVSDIVVRNLRSAAKTNRADVVRLVRASLTRSSSAPERTPTTDPRCRPFLARLEDVENDTTGKTATTGVVDAVRVLSSFAAALLEENDRLRAVTGREGTDLPPPTRTTSSSIDETTMTAATNPGDEVRPWDEQRADSVVGASSTVSSSSPPGTPRTSSAEDRGGNGDDNDSDAAANAAAAALAECRREMEALKKGFVSKNLDFVMQSLEAKERIKELESRNANLKKDLERERDRNSASSTSAPEQSSSSSSRKLVEELEAAKEKNSKLQSRLRSSHQRVKLQASIIDCMMNNSNNDNSNNNNNNKNDPTSSPSGRRPRRPADVRTDEEYFDDESIFGIVSEWTEDVSGIFSRSQNSSTVHNNNHHHNKKEDCITEEEEEEEENDSHKDENEDEDLLGVRSPERTGNKHKSILNKNSTNHHDGGGGDGGNRRRSASYDQRTHHHPRGGGAPYEPNYRTPQQQQQQQQQHPAPSGNLAPYPEPKYDNYHHRHQIVPHPQQASSQMSPQYALSLPPPVLANSHHEHGPVAPHSQQQQQYDRYPPQQQQQQQHYDQLLSAQSSGSFSYGPHGDGLSLHSTQQHSSSQQHHQSQQQQQQHYDNYAMQQQQQQRGHQSLPQQQQQQQPHHPSHTQQHAYPQQHHHHDGHHPQPHSGHNHHHDWGENNNNNNHRGSGHYGNRPSRVRRCDSNHSVVSTSSSQATPERVGGSRGYHRRVSTLDM